MTAIGSSAAVVIVLVVLIVVKVTSGSKTASSIRHPVSGAALSRLASVPVASMVSASSASTVGPPRSLPPGTPALTSHGKPEVFYLGAEYCPYCAAERWPLVMALAKFGTFSNLVSTESSSTDVNPNTPSFSFFGSSYVSPYLTFTAVETHDRAGKTLQAPTADQNQLITTYDAPPYTNGQAGSIPFIDLGGRYVVTGTEYDGSSLSNVDFDLAVGEVTAGTSATSRAVQGLAAHLVGAICSLTADQPASVCSAIPAALKTGGTSAGTQGSSPG
jgi:thiol-disulfide isomerase/thioredoxin